MKKTKNLLIVLFLSFVLLIIPNICKATDKYNAQSTINGITVNWEYELNKTNQIINLICKNPTELTGSVTIPETLDGKTVISIGNEAFKASTKITEIIIPNTVKEIGLWAFSGCTSLSKVDLGNIEKMNERSFEDCTALTSIKLPKTLKDGAVGAPFAGCTNLKNIELEEGMTIVPMYACAGTPITEITIPKTVKEIDLWAFSGCTNLSKVDLGNIEEMSERSFGNCTALTSIKLPKTLKEGAAGAPFAGCTNLKNIELEEGMTIVPMYACAGTPITEITIPKTVKEIDLWAFSGCTNLNKITILDNVKEMGGYSGVDYIFQNHNDDLTIYCYKDSVAANYAQKYNIKYVYLTKPSTEEPGNSNNENTTNNGNSNNKPGKDNTVAPTGKLPFAGAGIGITFIVIALIGGAVYAYIRYKNLKGI